MKNEEVHKSAPNETFELSDQWRMTVRGFSIFLDLFIFSFKQDNRQRLKIIS